MSRGAVRSKRDHATAATTRPDERVALSRLSRSLLTERLPPAGCTVRFSK